MIAVWVLGLAPHANAAFEAPWSDARTVALAGCDCPRLDSSPRSGGEGTGAAAHWWLEFSAGERFGLSEMRGWRATAVRPGPVLVGLEAARLGSRIYEERTLGLILGRRIDERLSVGLSLRALGVAFAGAEGSWTGSADAEVRLSIRGRFSAWARWENVGRAAIEGSPVASSMRLSGALVLDSMLIASSVLLESGLDPAPSLAIEFTAARVLRLRAGATTSPGTFAAGCGVVLHRESPRFDCVAVDVAWEWHPQLGVSSFASVSLNP